MFSHRHSCDRCRQQKVRCLKARDSPPTVTGSGLESHGTCERCAKADVPCVYSLKQKNRRAAADLGRDDGDTSPMRSRRFSHDLANMFIGNDGTSSGLGDMAMRMLDMGDTAVHDFNDGYQYSWNNPHNSQNSHSSSLPLLPLAGQNGDCTDIRTTQAGLDTSPLVPRTQTRIDSFGSSAGGPGLGGGIVGACGGQSDLTGQVMALSTRATRAVRQLDSAESGAALTVNSPVVSEAFEIANALIRIINSTDVTSSNSNPVSASASSASQPSPHGSDESTPIVDYGLVFQEFACHQHMLTLFGSICSSIKRSLASSSIASDVSHHHSQQPLHGDGASSAQFTMIMQLIVHLANRLGRSLRLETKGTTSAQSDTQMDDSSLFNSSVLTPTLDGGSESSGSGSGSRHGSPSCLVDLAQDMLGRLPDEHIKLKRIIQELQTRMEEGL